MGIGVPGRVAEILRRSTVQIRSDGRGRQSNGSGIIVAANRLITNAHVISADSVTVELWEGNSQRATVERIDRRWDLALLSLESTSASTVPAPLGDSDQLRAGTPVLAAGNPFGFVGAISSGVVHSVGGNPYDRSGLPWIQADIRLAPGNSGGPLANFQGQVVGINTMIGPGGIALAIPSRRVQKFLSRRPERATIGIVVRPVRTRDRRLGLLVLELQRDGTAEAASLLPGDILVAANGHAFRAVDDLQDRMDEATDSLLHLDFYRGAADVLRHVVVQLSHKRERTAA